MSAIELPDIARAALTGERYTDEIPDTLDLAERAALALNGLGGTIDPELRYIPFGIVHLTSRTPHMMHWACADVTCSPKYGEVFPLMRLACGRADYRGEEAGHRLMMLSSLQDGLYWDRAAPDRPWRNAYAPAFYGAGRNEDFAVVAASGILMRAISAWSELCDDPLFDRLRRELVAGMLRVAVHRDDYCYYPEKGGWGEPCTYPRSGWLNTDEPQSETQGGEGAITAYHGNQIYGAAQWYARSGDPAALQLCQKLTRFCMKPKFWGGLPDPDGKREGLAGHVAPSRPDPAYTAGAEQGHWFSHFHARAIALRGLLEYARVAQDERVMEFVRRAYEFTLTQGIPRIGWTNCYPAALDRCEGCALGDLVALGIRLSDAGLGDYWDDVDAVVRNHLVEQQLVRPDALERIAAASEEDKCRSTLAPGQACFQNVIGRARGTFGGTSLPNGIPSPWVMLCCTGNGTRGLYYAWEGCVREHGDTAHVNLLLNRAASLLDVHSHLPYEGKVTLRNKKARRVVVRIPVWVTRRQLQAELNGKPAGLDWVGNRVLLDELKPGDRVTLSFPVTETTARYTANANSKSEQAYTCTFRGSTLVEIAPREESPTAYPFYQRDLFRARIAPVRTVERFVPQRIVTGW